MRRSGSARLRSLAFLAAVIVAAVTALVLTSPNAVSLEPRPDRIEFDSLGDGTPVEAATPLADRLYLVRGGGGVTAVHLTSHGAVIVDPKYAVSWPALEREVRRLTDLPITHVIVTHFHSDHAEAVALVPPSAKVVAHANAIERMIFERLLPDDAVATGRALPYDDRLDLFEGDDALSLRWPQRAHTNGDTLVYFARARALHMGDVFPGKEFPIVHIEGGGDGRRFPEVVRETLAAWPEVDSIITGHGPVLGRRDMEGYGEFMQHALDYVGTEMGMFRDKTAIFKAYRPPARFADYDRARQFETLDEIDRSLRPRWQRLF